jgi:hypothetical protein
LRFCRLLYLFYLLLNFQFLVRILGQLSFFLIFQQPF